MLDKFKKKYIYKYITIFQCPLLQPVTGTDKSSPIQ